MVHFLMMSSSISHRCPMWPAVRSRVYKNLDAMLIRPPPEPPISDFMNIFIAIWAALETASCLLAPWLVLPCALCWSEC